MTQPLLSILICTMPKRHQMLQLLNAELTRQQVNTEHVVNIMIDYRMDITIGRKRQDLLACATGKMIVFIDDDDWIHPQYVNLICSRIEDHYVPDCIGMRGWITENGVNRKNWRISKTYGRWYEENNVYYRTPNHISPVRREIAQAVGFPDKSFGEDYDYSMGILPHLQHESFIEEDLYHYRFISNK